MAAINECVGHQDCGNNYHFNQSLKFNEYEKKQMAAFSVDWALVLWLCIRTVSYTHLDVYKRQDEEQRQRTDGHTTYYTRTQ